MDAPRADPTRCEPAVALAAREIKGGALFEAEIGPASVHSTALATARVTTDMIRSGQIQRSSGHGWPIEVDYSRYCARDVLPFSSIRDFTKRAAFFGRARRPDADRPRAEARFSASNNKSCQLSSLAHRYRARLGQPLR